MPVPDKDCSYHHIAPNNEIEMLIPQKSEPIEDQKQKLESYLNLPHIKQPILDNNLVNNNPGPDDNHGRVIHAAISNNPHNLVHGPKHELRGDDPESGKDNEILNAQPENYQAAYKTYDGNDNKTLEDFGKLPRTTPVKWEKTGTKKKHGKTYDQYNVQK